MKKLHNFIKPLIARDANEGHRAATELELLFDLVIVIAFASVAQGLHHSLIESHIAEGVLHFVMAFFMVWWPWSLFTWFASAFDNDDPLFRLAVMVMMAGSMIIAANLPQFFSTQDFTYTFVGYVIMRLSHVLLWLRAGRSNLDMRSTAKRYIVGQIITQCYWAFLIFGIESSKMVIYVLYFLGIAMELFVPWFAEKNTWY